MGHSPGSAFATVRDGQGRVLLCHRPVGDVWDLPGGGIEVGESPWDAVVREVAEETGLEVAVDRLVGIYWKPQFGNSVYQFTCSVTGNAEPQPSHEHDRLQWFAPAEMPERLGPNPRARIMDSLAATERALLVVQDGPSTIEWLSARDVM